MAADGAAQDHTGLGAPSCRACSIVIDNVTVISDRNTSAGFGDVITMSAGADGRLYAVSQLAPTHFAIFDKTGAFRGVHGTRGRGPGEFQFIRPPLVDAKGRLHVVDVFNLRRVVLSPTLEFVDEFPWPALLSFDAAVLAPDTIIAAGALRTPESAGLPYHTIGDDGLIESLGVMPDVYRADDSKDLSNYLASDQPSGRLLAVSKYGTRDAYNVRVLDRRGTPVKAWAVHATGFGDDRALRRNIAFEPPAPRVTGAWIGADGNLWILLLTADASYSPLPRSRAKGSEMSVSLSAADRHRIWDSVVDVVSVRTGLLLARRRFDEYLFHVKGSEMLFYYREGGDGEPTFPVVKLKLERNR